MKAKVTSLRTAFLQLVMDKFGPWYLVRAPSENWHPLWHHWMLEDKALEAFFMGDGSAFSDEFPSIDEALREIIRSLDDEIAAGGTHYVAIRQRAMASLVSNVGKSAAEAEQNNFAGTDAEADLIKHWLDYDQREAEAKQRAARARKAYDAACAEQNRREEAFERVLATFGTQVIEEVNTVIRDAWQANMPTSRRTAHGYNAGEIAPMPQLAITPRGAVFQVEGRTTYLRIKTPLSKRDASKGYVDHWKHPTWVEVVVPAMREIIEKLERTVSFP
jgi:hypothetical protein